ncbi:DUF4114 domain-containing protein [Microcoleus sp. C2C3]|uniref:DUF4114 domain-containing protein n=1 Tax=unclassified Microcoleus TaxID=2642155 RepID=UPI002FD5C3C3
MPLTDPLREPLTEIESLIPGLAPTFAPQLPGIGTNKTLLYQTPGSSENSEQPNLIEPASGSASEFSRTEADTFIIINKASDINSIPSANTSPLITNSTLRDTTNSELDPLIGKLDSGLGDPLTDPNRIASNNITSDSNKSATDIPPVNSSISNSELNKTTAATTAASDKLPENTTQLPSAAVGQSEPENSQKFLAVTADTTSEKATLSTTLVTTAETTSKPEEHPTPLSSETTLKSESESNKTSPATASTTDKSELNKTSLTENSTANNLETATNLEPDKASISSTSINFDSNAFSVDEKGIIGIEFTSDGGWYSGQLAIVNLLGMEKFVPGSEAFIKEAASRALSNSTNGYIAISDDLEGAYYTAPNSSENFNSGQYLGKKTFAMTPGDKFFFMLVPNGTVQQVYDNPAIGGDKKPLFSIATENPNDGFSIGQIADITGEGQLFVMEDMALSEGSDRDYDDITFRVTGATSQIVPLSQLAGSDRASIHSQLVQKLKGESDKSGSLFTAESTVTNSADTFPAQTPSITADNDKQKPHPTAATVANSDSQESLPTETSSVANSDTQESPATETSIVDKFDTQESPPTETSTVDKSDTQESPPTETSTVDKSDTQELQLIEQTASPPETLSVSPTELNSEIEQQVEITTEKAGDLIEDDTAFPEIAAELETEQLVTKTESIVVAPEAADTVESALPVAEITAELESEQLPQKTDALAVADFTATPSDTDIAVAFTAAELKTEKPPAIAVNSIEPEPLNSHSNSSVQTDSPRPALFSNSSETAAGTAQIASVETSVSPSTVKSPPAPTSNNYNSNSTPTETAGTPPAYSDTEIAPKPADISSGLLSLEAEESAQIEDGIADIVSNPTQRAGDFQSNTNPQANLSRTAAANSPSPGTFLVENADGQVKFDYQFDGGYYEGELGIFSLSGMEALTPGSPEFIAEAARRVLTNSTEGHLVIRDSIEGGKFTGAMPGEGTFGSDPYQGIKTFNMTPFDTFAVMFVPSGTVQSSLQFSWLWDLFPEMRPLFSIESANPNDTSYVLPIADATGTGNTFALEDMSAASSDKDYNDLIFKISGATGNAPLLDTVINPDKEWRNTPLGQQLLAEANPSNSDNNPPVVSPTSARTYTELETTISLDNLATDAEGDPLTISVLNPVNGTVIFNPLTNKASFKPEPGFSGIASFDFLASDAFGSSSPARVTVNVSDVPLLNLDFVKRNPRLNAGENTELVVLGDFADQQDVVLPDSYLTYTSLNPEVAPIDATGKVTGLTNGTSILSASRNNLQAVTAVRVGELPAPTNDAEFNGALAEINGLNVYPKAVTMTAGMGRSLLVGIENIIQSPDLKFGSTGTRYFPGNSNLLQVNSDGLITAIEEGVTNVTVIHGGAEQVVPVQVSVPVAAGATLGVNGGAVQGSDGSIVMVPPGALAEDTAISLTSLSSNALSLQLPDGLQFAGGFNLDLGEDSLKMPAQLAIPAPAGLSPGTEVLFMRKGSLPDANNIQNPTWLIQESGVVDASGTIRTNSPPFSGILESGEYAIFAWPTMLGLVGAPPTVQQLVNLGISQAAAGPLAATSGAGAINLSTNFGLQSSLLAANAGLIGLVAVTGAQFAATILLLGYLAKYLQSGLKVTAIPQVGLPVVTPAGVELDPAGIPSVTATLNIPTLFPAEPESPPVLQSAEYKLEDGSPTVVLTGSNFLNNSNDLGGEFEDLTVSFRVGDKTYPGLLIPDKNTDLGDNRYRIAVKIPITVPVGESTIVVSRRQKKRYGQGVDDYELVELESEENIRLAPNCVELALVTERSGDKINVINLKDALSTVETQNSDKLAVALNIPVGNPAIADRPELIAATNNATRAYVTLRQTGGVSVVDLIALREIDTTPETATVDAISLPSGARPQAVVIDPRDNYAYISDQNLPNIYVLDINPNSATYHTVVQTITIDSPSGLQQLAINSDERKLFVTAGDKKIHVVNIDPNDKPTNSSSNPRKWHEKIGEILTPDGAMGITATSDPSKITFTSGNSTLDGSGFGVLEITNSDPLSFAAATRYANLSLGSASDYFDVNEGVAVTIMKDGRYAFVAGRNSRQSNPEDFPDGRKGGNIGIIKDPLGSNPQLVAATRPIPHSLTNNVALSSDGKYLIGSYPTEDLGGNTYVFNVEEMIKAIENPGDYKLDARDRGVGTAGFVTNTERNATIADLARVPIDDINPLVSIAADFEITGGNGINNFVFDVPEGTNRAPIGLGGNPRGLAIASARNWLELVGPTGTSKNDTNPLTPTFKWDFKGEDEPCGLPSFNPNTDIKEVNLYVSVFPEGKGLLPTDRWKGLNSADEKDYNPNRILTAKWENNKWTWNSENMAGSSEPFSPSNNNEEFTLSKDLMLTAGQEYHWAVEAVTNKGERKRVVDKFKTLLPEPISGGNTFSSVTVLTRGLEAQSNLIDRQFEQMASHLTKEDGLVMRYDRATNKWGWLNFDGSTTFSPPTHKLGAPLVLIPGWEQPPEATAFNSGFTEAAADASFASLVALNQNLENTLFNSPMHFMGFGQGTAINNEIVQRLGTYFPLAGGTSLVNRDLQMTTIDPHDFDQDYLLGTLKSVRDPEVRIWENVTYADNYYQNVPTVDTQETNTRAGRRIAEADWNVHLGGSDGTGSLDGSSRIGFTEHITDGKPHLNALTWYGGTANLSGSQLPLRNGEKIYRRLGDLDLDSSGNPTTPTWYTPDRTNANFTHGEQRAPWEGIGTGWFYSVLGGGSQLRPYDVNVSNRVPVTEDNTYTDETIGNKMRGDYAVPTLFNGNFDATSESFSYQSVPGWSFYNTLTVSDNHNVSQRHLHERDEIDTFLTEEQRKLNPGLAGQNYTLKMGGTDGVKEIIHNLFLVPDRNSLHDSLKFDLHVPEDQLGAGRKITVSLRADVAGYEQFTSIGTIDLERGVSGKDSSPEELDSNTRKIGYGTEGFESFYLNVPQELRGKAALLKFELNDGTVYLDDISFGKKWEPSMTLAEAEEYTKNSYYSGRVLYHGTNPDGAASIAKSGVNPARFTRGYLGEGFYLTNQENMAKIFSRDENNQSGVGPVLKIILNVKNPKVYEDLEEFVAHAKNYGLETGVQEPELTVRYTEYLKSQGYDAIATRGPQMMQYHLVFDPKQVVVVEE